MKRGHLENTYIIQAEGYNLSIWDIISEKCYPKFLRNNILWKGYYFHTMDKIS